MKIPVILAARNEEQTIGGALDRLAEQHGQVEPIVVVNDTTDRTADIAIAMGAHVLESDPGKMRAIQTGLRYLGKAALGNVLLADVDGRPVSRHWGQRLHGELTGLPGESPAIVWGPVVFCQDMNLLVGAACTAASMRVSWADRHDKDPRTIRGGNAGLRLADAETLESLLELDNYWPREDVAIYDTVMSHGGNARVSFHPEAWMKTSGIRITDTLKALIHDRRHPSRVTDDGYAAGAPAGSRPYNSPYTRHQNKNPELGKQK
jgi:glycosyltransferase involved in cell wall biosynthesis